MANYLLLLLFSGISFSGLSIITDENGCNGCNYEGAISKVVKVKQGSFKPSGMDLGEFIVSLDIELCKLDENDSIELKGTVGSDVHREMSGIKILYCINENKIFGENTTLKVTDTLCTSDDHGNFSFKTKVSDDAFIIVVDRNDATGIVYSLSGFKIE